MRTYWFTEDCYPYLPDQDTYPSIRVDLPTSLCDPAKVNELYNWYLDLWGAADEAGLDIMNNEHHQTATCMVPAAPLMLAILARETKKARLLILGNPIANRRQPIRVAEEMAMIDCISKGRLDCGFVRGVPYEASPANMIAFRATERLWEAHDLILKCWTTHDGPFNFEGRWFHGRQVNVWPRPYQQPHPPVWVTMGSKGSGAKIASHKHVGAVFLAGYAGIRNLFDDYREGYLAAHGSHAPFDRLAYLSLIFVGDDERSAHAGAEKLLWYMSHNKVPPHWANPPGYFPPAVAARVMRGMSPGRGIPSQVKLAEQMARGNVFAGTPDQVFEQIRTFWEYSGGFGNLLMMGQAGFLDDKSTRRSMKLFAEEVFPRLKAMEAATTPEEAWDRMKRIPARESAPPDAMNVAFVR